MREFRNKHFELVPPVLVLPGLAFGAEVATPISDGDALNKCATDRAGLTTTMSHLKLKMGSAYLATGAKIGVHASPFITDS